MESRRNFMGCLWFVGLLGLVMLLASCSPSGDSDLAALSEAPSAKVEAQAIRNLLDLYRDAVFNEDIDRLQALLAPNAAADFRQALGDIFRSRDILAHTLQAAAIADDRLSVAFIDVLSALDPERLTQVTEVRRIVFRLVRQQVGEVIEFRIADTQRDDPLLEVATSGLLVSGPPSPLTLRAASGEFTLASAAITKPQDGARASLLVSDNQATGDFIAASGAQLHRLPIQARDADGDTLAFAHHYRLHQTQEGIAQRVSGTGATRFFALATTANGTLWAGGDNGAKLFQVAPGSSSAQFRGALLAGSDGRVEDLALDSLGRLHAAVFSASNSGVVLLDHGVFCQTVNANDAAYPFEVLDLSDNTHKPSPSTRLLAANDGAVWLFGSDGGVGLARDNFLQGQCPDSGVGVSYEPLYQRQTSELTTNTSPGFLAEPDGSLWFGTALGLIRLQDGVFTPVPFQDSLALPGDIETLEGLFVEIARAVFEARPLDTLSVGGLSVSDVLGSGLNKADLIYTMARDSSGSIWAGTLGGGLRRIEIIDGLPQDTLQLTRQDGLSSNLILALASGPDHTLWVGTDEGVSRIDTAQEPPIITTFTSLENVRGPVRDIVVDGKGVVWLATDDGLFRLQRANDNGDPTPTSAGRLIRVSGNNQSALPGQELSVPLVVRLENALGEPVSDAALSARVTQGEATFVTASMLTTDDQGEAEFRLQLGDTEEDLVVEVSAAEPDVAPVKFFAIIGAVDVPSLPQDIAVASNIAFIPSRSAGLQVIDVQDPTRPVLLHSGNPFNVDGLERLIAVRDEQAYLVTFTHSRFYIIDIRDPRSADFPKSTLVSNVPDSVIGMVELEEENWVAEAIAVREEAAYVAQIDVAGDDPAILEVVDIRDATMPQSVALLELPAGRASGVALRGDVAYVAAYTAGLLAYDIRDPFQPLLITTLAADPDPNDNLEIALVSRLTVDGEFAYVVQSQVDKSTNRQVDRLLVIDVQTPAAPRLRGSVPLRVATIGPTLSFTGTGLAVRSGFAYLPRSALGVQVVDVRHPDAPRLVGLLDTPSSALRVAATNDLIYVVDSVFGLQVIQGAGDDLSDRDGDGVLDVFDHFPLDPSEFQDLDGDSVGDHTDSDDDNDGFSDADEQQSTTPSDPHDPLSFPVTAPPAGVTVLHVDAASNLPAQVRNGARETPYRSISEALQALRSGQTSRVDTLRVAAGAYTAVTTGESFPLNFSGLSQFTLQGAGHEVTVLDAAFVDDVIAVNDARHLAVEGVTLTQGVHGIQALGGAAITVRQSRCADNAFDGIHIFNVRDAVISGNVLDGNGEEGLTVFGGQATATITDNVMRNNERIGVNIVFGAHGEISNNVIEDNIRDGIFSQDASTVISNNRIRKNQRNGIWIFSNSIANISRNTIEENLHGIFSFESTSMIIDNMFINNYDMNLVIVVDSIANIINNSIADSMVGIRVDFWSSADILDNSITAKRVGMAMLESSATLSNNTVSAGVAGLVVQGQDASVALRSGALTDSSFAAIHLLGGATLEMGLGSMDGPQLMRNSGIGLLVTDDGSLAKLNSDHLQFEANAGDDVLGPVVDVADGDGDGVGNAAEIDTGTDPAVADTDGDDLLDGFELRHDFDPLTSGDGEVDTDGDGLSNGVEQTVGTDPRNADTDGDGLTDTLEINQHDTDPLRIDTDGDGLQDGSEVQAHGTDPTLADSDGDGLGDGEETLLSGLDPRQPTDAAAAVDLITNGGFEDSNVQTKELTGWTVSNLTSGTPGYWGPWQEATSERFRVQMFAPPEGATAAIAESVSQSIMTLSQEIEIPAATSAVLGVDVMVISSLPFLTSEAFSLEPGQSHQFRIDLLNPEAPALAVGDEVLAPLFRTEAGDPTHNPYRRLLFDLTPYAGRRVVLRFTQNQTLFGLLVGIDNVRLLATGTR